MDARALSAIWLWKHQHELVEDCRLGTVTKTACKKRLEAISGPRRWKGNGPHNPAGCIGCRHAEGILWNEADEGIVTKWGGTATDSGLDEEDRLDEIEPPLQAKSFEIWA